MQRLLIYILLSAILSGNVLAKIPVKQKERLNENWVFVAHDLGGVWEAVRPAKKDSPEEQVVWKKVSLPHCFNAEDAVDPDVKYYQGAGWYKTLLDIKNPYKKGRILLEFEGAGQNTDVYVYTTKVGSHIGGYDSWNVDITDAVTAFLTHKDAERFEGKIPLVIRCENARDLETIPSDLSDFNLYGGIYRYLNLVYLPEVSVSAIKIEPVLDKKLNSGTLKVTSSFYNPIDVRQVDLHVVLRDPNGRIIHDAQLKNITPLGDVCVVDIPINKPQIWSVDHPLLYTCEITVLTENQQSTASERFGFRHFEFIEQGPFMLNGKRLLLKGTHRHEDHAGVGAAMTEEQMIFEMRLMKDMGVNFIRLGHYQQSEIILNLCDELGILVWEEIPWCRGGIGGNRYRTQAKRMLTNMIQQHYNHPAVIIWGLGNENDWPNDFATFDQAEIRAFMSELNVLSHQLDHTRKTAIRRCAFCSDIVDVYSPSIWAGWYHGQYTDYQKRSSEEMEKVKHFLHVEWGGDSHAGRHVERNASKVDWSETYIVKLIDWHLKEQENMPWLTGAAYWPFKDFSTPVRPDNPVPYVNQKGVVERDLTKKESFYVFQSYWTKEPMIRIYGHDRPIRWGDAGEKKEILVYSNCSSVELFVNGVSAGIKTRNSQDFPAAGLRWDVAFNEGNNIVKAVGKGDKKALADEIQFEYQTQKWGDPAYLHTSLEKEGDITTVKVQLMDKDGIRCLESSDFIRFDLVGDGKFIQNQGTVRASRKVQLVNGRAQISVNRQGGKSVVTMKVNDLPTQFITVEETTIQTTLQKQILESAAEMLNEKPVTITSFIAKRSSGGIHDFYSEGDYWWPDPNNPDGPYIQRDGETNPDNFVAHRHVMVRFSMIVGNLTSAYLLTKKDQYMDAALQHIRAWLIDDETKMNPSLLYAQAIKGVATGRGIGIIDTIHLIEVAQSLIRLKDLGVLSEADLQGTQKWFSDYLEWISTHPYGIKEMNAANNHGTCWAMQAAVFAKYTGNKAILEFCTGQFKNIFLAGHMAGDGSFPREISRTKPYGYSLFNLDAMATLCHVLSNAENNLWEYATPDGKCMRKGIEFLYPYVINKEKWPHGKDVMYWNEWPVAQPFLFFGGLNLHNDEYLQTWAVLEHFPKVDEVLRNLPVRNPILWIN